MPASLVCRHCGGTTEPMTIQGVQYYYCKRCNKYYTETRRNKNETKNL